MPIIHQPLHFLSFQKTELSMTQFLILIYFSLFIPHVLTHQKSSKSLPRSILRITFSTPFLFKKKREKNNNFRKKKKRSKLPLLQKKYLSNYWDCKYQFFIALKVYNDYFCLEYPQSNIYSTYTQYYLSQERKSHITIICSSSR